MHTHYRVKISKQKEQGFSLIEMMIAMVILAVGLGSLTVLFVTAMNTNLKSKGDTGATMAAQAILEQIAAQPAAQGSAAIVVTDCAGTQYKVATDGGAPNPAGTGSGATLVPQTPGSANAGYPGEVDWSAAAPSAATAAAVGYAIPQFADCGTAGGARVNYEIRWNVKQLTTYSRQIVVGAREAGSQRLGGLRFMLPVSLRTIGGQ